MKRLTAFVLGIVALSFTSCSSSNGTGSQSLPPVPQAIVVTASGPGAVAAGSSTTFTAAVQNTSNTAVTWSVNGVAGGNSTTGTISTSGSFTAPNLPPAGGSITITAVSQADSTKSGSVTVAIQFSNASVQGAYAFSVSGSSSGGTIGSSFAFSAAGRFQANGSGTITNGTEDFNGATGIFTNLAFTGSYSVGADGRGTATITSSLGTTVYRALIIGTGQVQLIGFNPDDSINGFATPQASSLSLSAIAGDWSFFLSGSSGGALVVDAGRFTVDSAGNITLGAEDQNSGGVITQNASFTGTASSVATNGRGTVSLTGTLGTANLAFYVDSANGIYFIDTDSGTFLSGSAYRQSSRLSNSSLTGTYVFLLAGADSLGRTEAEVGAIAADGNGHFTSGSFDLNDNGNAALNQPISGGTYSVASNGRGTASVTSAGGTSAYTFYLASQNLAVFMETDSVGVTEGLAALQSGAPFSNSSISGSFGLTSAGLVTTGAFESVGRLTANSGSLSSGVEDVSQAGTPVAGVALSGTYSIASSGRGTAQLSGGGGSFPLVFYVVNSSLVEYLEVDPSEVIAGFVAKQF